MGEYRFGVLGVLVGALYCMVAVDSVVQSAETRQQIIQRVNSTTVTIVAGSLDSTSARLVQDLGTALNDGEKQRILPVLGFDSAQNIADVLYLKGVDAGIVYADVLDAVHEDNFIPDINLTLQYIAELGTENIFIIAGKDIRDINDLAGKTVNFGAGAGDGYTPSALLFKSLGIDVKRTNLPHTVALKKNGNWRDFSNCRAGKRSQKNCNQPWFSGQSPSAADTTGRIVWKLRPLNGHCPRFFEHNASKQQH